MNYEEGSEPSMQDGEGFTETGLTEAHGLAQPAPPIVICQVDISLAGLTATLICLLTAT